MKKVAPRLFAAVAAFCFLSGEVTAADAEKTSLPAVLTPYLQNPAADGMTVCFVAQEAEQVRVTWGATGTEVAATSARIPGTPWTIWKARLTGLRPGTAHPYEVRYRLNGEDTKTPVYRFRALDPRAETLKVAAFNDIHNRTATLEALMKHVKPDDYEFSLLLGDCWTDPSAANGAHEVFRALQEYIRLLDGANKPFVLVRGNHEVRGNFAKHLAYLFDLPALDAAAGEYDQQWQFTLQPGPVWFLALDGGEDFTKRFENFQPLRQRQTEWTKELLARGEGAGGWRVLLTHMPLYNDNIWNSEPCRLMWEPVLSGAALDIALAGHDHTWKLLPKGKTYTIDFPNQRPDKQDPQNRAQYSFTTPWPVLIGGGPAPQGDEEGTVMLLSADATTLRIRLLGAKDGRVLTEFVTDRKVTAATNKSP